MTDERLNCIKEQISEGIALFWRDDVKWLVEELERHRARDEARARTPKPPDFWACEAPDTCHCPHCEGER